MSAPHLRFYESRDDMPSYILEQCIKLRDTASLFYHQFSVKNRLSNISIFVDWHSFFTDKSERIITCELGRGESTKVVACLHFSYSPKGKCCSTDSIWISNIWTEPEYRKNGLAHRMVRTLFDKYPGSQIEIGVLEGNTVAQEFWKSVGFVTKTYSHYVLFNEGDEHGND